jgi:holo-[acyl-carrier protein] synthase
MENEIKSIYTTLSNGKVILNNDFIISLKHFNSISSDKFISELKKKGIHWDGEDIKFSNLLNINLENNESLLNKSITDIKSKLINTISTSPSTQIGIDIQEINELPNVIDYWEDDFYISKFTPEEIAYCVSKENPKESFSGIFSCKEALIKSNINLKWEDINISHDDFGKPFFKNYPISISHSGNFSISIAMNNQLVDSKNSTKVEKSDIFTNSITSENFYDKFKTKKNNKFVFFLILILSVCYYFNYNTINGFFKLFF